ncbi:MAG: alpha/beta hydrolase [Deltaproteobacteria bacterium]|nr:alpha/beta hydrolase [Deltaproteobacteria bacterium]
MSALHHTRIVAEGAQPSRWVLFLHGIFGSGANWRTFARRWVERDPSWGAVLVDLRKHGASQDLPPPHTVQNAANDLIALELPGPVEAVVGHSFGGKVALAYVEARRGDLSRAVILDSTPGARPDHRGSESTLDVLAFLERVGPVPHRDAFVARGVDAGISAGIGQWLAMNLERRGDAMVLKLDLDAVRALLNDYFRIDLWEVLERPPGRVVFDVVLGGRSTVFDASERAKLQALAAAQPNRIRITELPNAGHWVHVDDPEGVARVLLQLP